MKADTTKAGFGGLSIKSLGVQNGFDKREAMAKRQVSDLDAKDLADFLAWSGWDVTIRQPSLKTLERRCRARDAYLRKKAKEAARG